MKILCNILTAIALSAFITSCGNSSKTVESNNKPVVHNHRVKIAYIDTGSHDTTLLFVHGWGINKSYWAGQVKYFAPHYRIVAMDMASFGESGKNRNSWTNTDFAGDVDSVIKQLDLKKVILIGHSMAGDVVLQAAIDNPDRVIGLVGIDNFKGPGAPESPEARQQYAAAMAEMKKHFKAVVTDWFNQQLFYKTTSQQVRQRVMGDVFKADSAIAIASLEDTSFHELPKLMQVKKKLYVLGSDVTPVDTTYMYKAKVPFKIYYVHATGHYPMIEKPDEFNTQLGKTLADIQKDK
jgi:pimeloyl-ACP methyl ester carboxylesterase